MKRFIKILQQSGLKSHDMMNPVTFWQLDKNQKGLDFDFKKEQFGKHHYSLSYQDFDEKIDTTLMSVC